MAASTVKKMKFLCVASAILFASSFSCVEGMGNPAAIFCTQKGGTLKAVTTAMGQDANCVLKDGTVCAQW